MYGTDPHVEAWEILEKSTKGLVSRVTESYERVNPLMRPCAWWDALSRSLSVRASYFVLSVQSVLSFLVFFYLSCLLMSRLVLSSLLLFVLSSFICLVFSSFICLVFFYLSSLLLFVLSSLSCLFFSSLLLSVLFSNVSSRLVLSSRRLPFFSSLVLSCLVLSCLLFCVFSYLSSLLFVFLFSHLL